MQKFLVLVGFILLGVLTKEITKKFQVPYLATAHYTEHWILMANPVPRITRTDTQRSSHTHPAVGDSVVSPTNHSSDPFLWSAVHANSRLD